MAVSTPQAAPPRPALPRRVAPGGTPAARMPAAAKPGGVPPAAMHPGRAQPAAGYPAQPQPGQAHPGQAHRGKAQPGAMPPGYKPSRRLKLGRSLALPLAAVGMTILLPWRAADLLHQWEALSTPAAAAQSLPAPVTPGNAPASGATQPGQAGAQPAQRAAPGQAAAAAKTPASAAGMLPGADRAADGRLLSEIAQRTAVLDQRDSELQTRAAQVAAAEQLARQQIAELTRLRQEVEKLVAHESGASEADLNLLVGLYSNMKPAQAAAVLGRLQPPMAAEILQRLDTHAAGPVLAAMDPAAALAITEVLTQRREAFRK